MSPRSLTHPLQFNSCYFRTGPDSGRRKALIQITERCDLHCAHCFVSATRHGRDLSLDEITGLILPRLLDAKVDRVTLTGGEPFAHPDLVEIALVFVAAGMDVGICTNGNSVSEEQMSALAQSGRVHVNVSIDGWGESHDAFRGSRGTFGKTRDRVRDLSRHGLLQGILSTPHEHASCDDYRRLGEFCRDVGATYFLLNPLAEMGRGVQSAKKLRSDEAKMSGVVETVKEAVGDSVDVVPIRIPEADQGQLPLAPCVAGDVIYVFADGTVATCPYLVFAARSPRSRYSDSDFIAGNILDGDIALRLDGATLRDRYPVSDVQCDGCELASRCGRGCPAAVVGQGGWLSERDQEACPF